MDEKLQRNAINNILESTSQKTFSIEDFLDYQLAAHESIMPDTRERHIANWSIGLAEEVGEVAGLIKHDQFRHEPLREQDLAKELGDVLWYIAAIASEYGLSLATIAKLNIAKLRHRFEGDDFTFAGSHNRHQLEQQFERTSSYLTLLDNLRLPEELLK